MLGSGLQGTWHLKHPVAATASCKLRSVGVKSPSFGGREKTNPEN